MLLLWDYFLNLPVQAHYTTLFAYLEAFLATADSSLEPTNTLSSRSLSFLFFLTVARDVAKATLYISYDIFLRKEMFGLLEDVSLKTQYNMYQYDGYLISKIIQRLIWSPFVSLKEIFDIQVSFFNLPAKANLVIAHVSGSHFRMFWSNSNLMFKVARRLIKKTVPFVVGHYRVESVENDSVY